MRITEAINELKKFSNKILTLGDPCDEKLIAEFEIKYNLNLPIDFKHLIKKHNGVDLLGTSIYGIKDIDSSYSLEECYLFEHFEVENKMPAHLVPFSPDGAGNHYCFDTKLNTDSCPIVFWQHDYNYSDDDLPEVTNNNLAEWIEEVMIKWTLEDYNYDGSEKK